jgi:hypothetical protein
MIAAYLELVLAGLSGRGRVEKINGENLNRQHHISIDLQNSSIKALFIYLPSESTRYLVRPSFVAKPSTLIHSSAGRVPHPHTDMTTLTVYEGANPYHIDGLESKLVCIRSD